MLGLSCLVDATFQTKTGHSLYQAWGRLMKVAVQVETGHHLCLTWGNLARSKGMQMPAAACLEFVEKFLESSQHEPRQDTCVEKPLEVAWASSWSWVGQVPRESPGWG